MNPVPCVGCGWCCLSDQCRESHLLYGYRRRCPDLYWDEAKGRYKCALIDHPVHGEAARRALAVGEGCCARFNTWRNDVKNRDG